MSELLQYLESNPRVYKKAERLPLWDRVKSGPACRMARDGHWKKLLNYSAAKLALRAGLSWVPSKPYHLCVDPSTACQLRCPFCLHISGYEHGNRFMPFEDYKTLLRELGATLFRIDLSKGSEPFLHPRILDMVALAHNYGIETTLSSNLNHLPPGGAQAVARSGLDLLIVSADGASQESYEKYRVGGDFDTVTRNMRDIMRAKKEFGLSSPYVCWQFFVFKHNQHEIKKAVELACELGVDQIMFHPPYVPDELKAQWQTDLPEFSVFDYCHSHIKQDSCVWPWGSLNIRPDGTVSLCYLDNTSVGNIKDIRHFMDEHWNGEYFKKARRLIKERTNSGSAPDLNAPHPCARCHAMGKINFSV